MPDSDWVPAELVRSRQNETVRGVRALRARRRREASASFFGEGIRITLAAVESRCPIELVVWSPELLRSRIPRGLLRSGVPTLTVTADVFRSISARENPTGIGIVAKNRIESLDSINPDRGLCRVTLVRPQDPGNVGTILRTCDAVGAAGIILLDDSADPYDPKSVRSSMGSIFTQEIVRATFAQFEAWVAAHGCQVVAAVGDKGVSYRRLAYRKPVTLLLGSERAGLGPEHLRLADDVVHIPMRGAADSLNLAVAAGVLLYEIFHQLP